MALRSIGRVVMLISFGLAAGGCAARCFRRSTHPSTFVCRDPRDRQRPFRNVFRDRRSGADVSAPAHRHPRDELRVAADEDALADRRLVLLDPVVVAGDDARADVRARSDVRVAQVRQVLGLDAVVQGGVLRLDEVPHRHVLAEDRAGTQPRERTDMAAGTDARSVEVLAVGAPDHRSGRERRIHDPGETGSTPRRPRRRSSRRRAARTGAGPRRARAGTCGPRRVVRGSTTVAPASSARSMRRRCSISSAAARSRRVLTPHASRQSSARDGLDAALRLHEDLDRVGQVELARDRVDAQRRRRAPKGVGCEAVDGGVGPRPCAAQPRRRSSLRRSGGRGRSDRGRPGRSRRAPEGGRRAARSRARGAPAARPRPRASPAAAGACRPPARAPGRRPLRGPAARGARRHRFRAAGSAPPRRTRARRAPPRPPRGRRRARPTTFEGAKGFRRRPARPRGACGRPHGGAPSAARTACGIRCRPRG